MPLHSCAFSHSEVVYPPLMIECQARGVRDLSSVSLLKMRPKTMLAPPAPVHRPTAGASMGSTLERALRKDADGNITLGGKGSVRKNILETWSDRTGLCAPTWAGTRDMSRGSGSASGPFFRPC